MKPINERAGGKSLMEYNTPPPQRITISKAIPNPLLGESEGEYRRKILNEQYKEYAKKSMERSKERSTSKRMQRHLQKKDEGEKSRSPQ